MQGLSRNLTDTIKDRLDFDEEEASPNRRRLLNTIRVPKDLLMISERLPKPQYHVQTERQSKMKRNSSVPDGIDMLPEIP
jgi:hypothetical protein